MSKKQMPPIIRKILFWIALLMVFTWGSLLAARYNKTLFIVIMAIIVAIVVALLIYWIVKKIKNK